MNTNNASFYDEAIFKIGNLAKRWREIDGEQDLRTVQRAEILITQRTATFQFLTLGCEGRQKVGGYVPWNMARCQSDHLYF